jgi:hypothetical protein
LVSSVEAENRPMDQASGSNGPPDAFEFPARSRTFSEGA